MLIEAQARNGSAPLPEMITSRQPQFFRGRPPRARRRCAGPPQPPDHETVVAERERAGALSTSSCPFCRTPSYRLDARQAVTDVAVAMKVVRARRRARGSRETLRSGSGPLPRTGPRPCSAASLLEPDDGAQARRQESMRRPLVARSSDTPGKRSRKVGTTARSMWSAAASPQLMCSVPPTASPRLTASRAPRRVRGPLVRADAGADRRPWSATRSASRDRGSPLRPIATPLQR